MNKSFVREHLGIFLFLIGIIVVGVVTGFGVVLNNQRCQQVGLSIKNLELQRDDLRKRIAAQNSHIDKYTNQISLRKQVENWDLRRPSADQILVVRRNGFTPATSIGQNANYTQTADASWGILDIAFMMPPAARDTAQQ